MVCERVKLKDYRRICNRYLRLNKVTIIICIYWLQSENRSSAFSRAKHSYQQKRKLYFLMEK